MGINWNMSSADLAIAGKIAERAVAMASENGVAYDYLDAIIDITACHLNGAPLELQAMLDADDFNFAHDAFGIRRHIDRTTGKLGDCFLPRFANLNSAVSHG